MMGDVGGAPKTRNRLLKEIDEKGSGIFTIAVLDGMNFHHPEVLQMAHGFAMRSRTRPASCRAPPCSIWR